MAGLIGAFLGGAAPGVAKMGEMAYRDELDEKERLAREKMEQRIYERGQVDKATQTAEDRAWDLQKMDASQKHEKAMVDARKDPLDQKIKQKQYDQMVDASKMPEAVRMEYSALINENKSLAEKISAAQISGTYDAEAAKPVELKISANNARAMELARKYQGDAAPKQSRGLDDLFPARGENATSTAKPASQPASQPTANNQPSPIKGELSVQQAKTLLERDRQGFIKLSEGDKARYTAQVERAGK